MDADVQPAGAAAGRPFLKPGKIMPPVYQAERPVVSRLQAELYADVSFVPEAGKQVEHVILEAVGSGPDFQAGNIGNGERLPVKTLQFIGGSIGIGKRLKIGNEF